MENLKREVLEHRKHKRIRYMRNVSASMDDGRKILLDVLDFSMSGMGLVSKIPFKVGDVLNVHSVITRDGIEREVSLKGEVIYSHKKFQEYAIGVSF